MKNKIFPLLLSVLATLLALLATLLAFALFAAFWFLLNTSPVTRLIVFVLYLGIFIRSFCCAIKAILDNIKNKDDEKQID